MLDAQAHADPCGQGCCQNNHKLHDRRRFFDHDKAAGVSRDNSELIDLAGRTLAEAFAQGQLRSPDLKRVQIAARALVYGFARMGIDGHFPRWGVAAEDAERTAEGIIDLFIEGIAKVPGK